MIITRFNGAFTADVFRAGPIDVPNQFSFTGAGAESTGDRERWREIVDLLLTWRVDSSKLIAEGLEPPAREVIEAVLRSVVIWRNRVSRPPDRVMPNDDGGIALEWYREPWDYDVEFARD